MALITLRYIAVTGRSPLHIPNTLTRAIHPPPPIQDHMPACRPPLTFVGFL